uniref:Putative secreted protein n=1 Tax=Ixodes ricinus TaxID=34613 RepID=A0A6B0UVF8_IXORI
MSRSLNLILSVAKRARATFFLSPFTMAFLFFGGDGTFFCRWRISFFSFAHSWHTSHFSVRTAHSFRYHTPPSFTADSVVFTSGNWSAGQPPQSRSLLTTPRRPSTSSRDPMLVTNSPGGTNLPFELTHTLRSFETMTARETDTTSFSEKASL